MFAALVDAEASMAQFRADPTEERARAAHSAVVELSDVLLAHLAHEERDMEPLSATNHQSAQIKRAQRAVRRAHHGNTGTLFAWLQDGSAAATTTAESHRPGPDLIPDESVTGPAGHCRVVSTRSNVW